MVKASLSFPGLATENDLGRGAESGGLGQALCGMQAGTDEAPVMMQDDWRKIWDNHLSI